MNGQEKEGPIAYKALKASVYLAVAGVIAGLAWIIIFPL